MMPQDALEIWMWVDHHLHWSRCRLLMLWTAPPPGTRVLCPSPGCETIHWNRPRRLQFRYRAGSRIKHSLGSRGNVAEWPHP